MTAAVGLNGSIVLDKHTITITRKAAFPVVTKGRRYLPLAAVTSVRFSPASRFVKGYLSLTVGGGDRQSSWGTASVGAVADENAVQFDRKQAAQFETLRDEIMSAMVRR